MDSFELTDEPKTSHDSMRLSQLHVENYKSIDRLVLDLPPPSTPEQLDAFVLGSRNGIGKSSLLECCALVLVGSIFPELMLREQRLHDMPTPYDTLIRSGTSQATIRGSVSIGKKNHKIGLTLTPSKLTPTKKLPLHDLFLAARRNNLPSEEEFLDSLLGMNTEPLVAPPVLLFHSYRKVLEGNSALGAMVDPTFSSRRYPSHRYPGTGPLSTFKIVLIRALMARSGLFEGVASKGNSQIILDQLNGLLRDFAGGKVDKLRPGPNGTLELRVAPVVGGSASFNFDGLSSGQKEIIATLFLIWYLTQDIPSIVLIDEPELHLNAEWQRIFVNRLAELAPHNQYLLATHSEEVFGSVTADRRFILQGG